MIRKFLVLILFIFITLGTVSGLIYDYVDDDYQGSNLGMYYDHCSKFTAEEGIVEFQLYDGVEEGEFTLMEKNTASDFFSSCPDDNEVNHELINVEVLDPEPGSTMLANSISNPLSFGVEDQIEEIKYVDEYDFTKGQHIDDDNEFPNSVRDGETSGVVFGEDGGIADGENWYPKYDVIFGYEPDYWEDIHSDDPSVPREMQLVSGGRPGFFLCGPDAEMYNGFGDTTSTVVSADAESHDSDFYKCTYDEFEREYIWTLVEECNTGLDHDGDGGIDHPESYYQENGGNVAQDLDCAGITDDEHSSIPSCETGVREMELEMIGGSTETHLVAQYETNDGCSTDDLEEEFVFSSDDRLHSNWFEGEEPEIISCNVVQENPQECDGIRYPYDGGGNEIVKYKATEDYFHKLAEVQETSLEFGVVETNFVSDAVGWQNQVQSLYQAEQEYSGTQDEHDISTWDIRITANVTHDGDEMPAVEASYGDGTSTSDEHLLSWEPSHAVAGNEIASNLDLDSGSTSSEVFKGGWAGNCPDGASWQYEDDENEFTCSGALGVDQAVLLFESNENEPGETGKVGLAVMPSIAAGLGEPEDHWPTGWETYSQITDLDDVWPADNLESLQARCWPGTRADEEDMMNDVRYFDGEIGVNSEDIFGIHGELDFEDQTNFACRWEYTTEEDISGIPAVPQAQVFGDEHVLAGLGNLVEIHNKPTGDAEHFIEEYDLSSEDPQVIGGDDDFTIFTENHTFTEAY